MCIAPALAFAQSAALGFGQSSTNTSHPIEMTSQTLEVSQTDGSALFIGDVLIIQGDLRLNADRVRVINNSVGTGIKRLEASGNVILVSGPDAAKAQSATYTIASNTILMTGNVLVSQGPTTLSSDQMTIDIETGKATLSGKVRTILSNGIDE